MIHKYVAVFSYFDYPYNIVSDVLDSKKDLYVYMLDDVIESFADLEYILTLTDDELLEEVDNTFERVYDGSGTYYKIIPVDISEGEDTPTNEIAEALREVINQYLE